MKKKKKVRKKKKERKRMQEKEKKERKKERKNYWEPGYPYQLFYQLCNDIVDTYIKLLGFYKAKRDVSLILTRSLVFIVIEMSDPSELL